MNHRIVPVWKLVIDLVAVPSREFKSASVRKCVRVFLIRSERAVTIQLPVVDDCKRPTSDPKTSLGYKKHHEIHL